MSVTVNLHVSKFEAKKYGGFAVVEMSDGESEASVFFHSAAELDALIKAAVAARSMLPGETSEPVPQEDKPLCGEAKTGAGGVMCTRPADHAGGHKHEYSGTYWPRHDGGSEDALAEAERSPTTDWPKALNALKRRDGGSEDLDAALTPPGYSLPAGELAAEDGACTATTPTGFKDAVFRCIAHAGHNGPHEAWGDSGLLARWDDADAPAKADAR